MVANISPADPQGPRGQKVKIKLFLPAAPLSPQMVKIQLFQSMVMLHIKGIANAGDWDYVAVLERLPALHYSVDFIFLSLRIMGFIVELKNY